MHVQYACRLITVDECAFHSAGHSYALCAVDGRSPDDTVHTSVTVGAADCTELMLSVRVERARGNHDYTSCG